MNKFIQLKEEENDHWYQKSPCPNVGIIESDSTVKGMYPNKFATPLFLPEENTRIVTSNANINIIHEKTLTIAFSTFFLILLTNKFMWIP